MASATFSTPVRKPPSLLFKHGGVDRKNQAPTVLNIRSDYDYKQCR